MSLSKTVMNVIKKKQIENFLLHFFLMTFVTVC